MANKNIRNLTLIVCGYPPSVKPHEIKNAISKFGSIQRISFKENYTSIKFESANVYTNIEKKIIHIRDTRLKLAVRGEKKIQSTVDTLLSYYERDEIVTMLKKHSNEENQLNIFLQEIQLPYFEMQQIYGQVCSDLDDIINKHIPNSKILPFGSTMMGISVKKSDIDIFIAIPAGREPVGTDARAVHWTNRARIILNKCSKFSRVIAITNAKVPIIQCFHRSTKTMCDINFKSPLGVCNSNFIKTLLAYNSRLKPALLVLKYWAKIHRLTRIRGFTNYALLMMFIFHLQQPEINVMPGICKFQSPNHTFIIEGWDAGFNNDFYFIMESFNKCATVPKLLTSFFDFYANFDFEHFIILPYVGYKMLKSDFNVVENLPDCYSRYKRLVLDEKYPPIDLKPRVSLQDPFEQNRNVTKNLDLDQLNKFKKLCKNAYKVCLDSVDSRATHLLPDLLSMPSN